MSEGEQGLEKEGRAILIGAGEDRQMAELGRLSETLGLEVVGVLEQGRRDGAGYLGRGKREELGNLLGELGAGLVVVDDELSASQARVLEKAAGATVVDRTLLIIRIFEAHARDAASRLEVELAELTYRLPRVRGGYKALSRLGGGGVTTRGPGEQQLEYDRRVIRQRMEKIRKRLSEERAARQVRGTRLKKEGPPSVALVGYTNAGKTTILNAMSGESRSTADRLFETLETTTRLVSGSGTAQVAVPEVSETNNSNPVRSAKPDFVLTDTVGFIRKLPTQLVHSFASTLEAATEADILILCADASSEQLEQEIRTVELTLAGALREGEGVSRDTSSLQESILCLNKTDIVSDERRRELVTKYPDAALMSAREDAHPLLDAIYASLSSSRVRMRLLIPHAEYGAVNGLYGRAEIHAREDTTEGLKLDVTLSKRALPRYARYEVAV